MAPSVADLVAVSFLPKDAQLLGVDFGDSLTATGSNSQANAYQLERNVNRFTTVTSVANSAKLPKAESIANGIVIVRNDDSADLLYLFPYSGDSINALASNIAIEVLPGSVATAYKISSTKWIVTIDSGASGSGVPVGATEMYLGTSAPAGWLLLQGGTIGNASSGATARANADTEALFTHYWNNLANAQAPVSTGRGASAAADFAANKTLTIPDMRQRFPIGLAAAGTGSTIGGTGGNIDHTHSVPAHYHGMGAGADLNITASGSHAHGVKTAGGGASVRLVNDAAGDGTYNTAQTLIDTSTHTHASGDFAGRIGLVTNGVDGNAAMTSGTANPPFLAVNFIVKY